MNLKALTGNLQFMGTSPKCKNCLFPAIPKSHGNPDNMFVTRGEMTVLSAKLNIFRVLPGHSEHGIVFWKDDFF